MKGDGNGRGTAAELAMIMRIAEELTNRPVGSISDAMEILMEHLVRYRRTQERLNDVAGFALNDPLHLDVFDTSVLIAERYAVLTRSIRSLASVE